MPLSEWLNISPIDWKTLVVPSTALLGAALGILNTWNSISQRKVKLRVRPAYAIAVPSRNVAFSIEVVNLSSFPITLSDVGLTIPKLFGEPSRQAIADPMVTDGKRLPRRLETREAVSFYFDPYIFRGKKIGEAYARTVCGETEYGTSQALLQLKELAESN
jgi:hypothetical protein